MAILMDASEQWARRPADERFTSLPEMLANAEMLRRNSKGTVVSSRNLQARPVEHKDGYGLCVVGPNDVPVTPTHWSFGQLAQRAGAPAGYMRDLPAPIAADCINYGLHRREVEELGVLLQRPNGHTNVAAVTGPNYGRIWNDVIIRNTMRLFGDGRNGDFRIPGEFGQQVEITKANTTLFAGDRDCFIFMADETNRIELPNRRNGQTGTLARGFFIRNSDVGAASFVIDTFLFDYACSNRIVWGVSNHAKVAFRHTKGAPDRFIEQVAPALDHYREESTGGIVESLKAAQAKRIGDKDAVRSFLEKRFTKTQATAILAAHMEDEGRPIETLWDVATGATAYARGLQHQDARFDIEKEAGKVLDLVAVK